MKKLLYLFFLVLFGCSGTSNENKSDKEAIPGKMKEPATLAEATENFKDYNGIGPIKPFELPAEVDTVLANEGEKVFTTLCTACHKTDKRFIGPAPKDIFNRRNPSWVMNMILNPEEMLAKDPIAKLLYVEYNMSPMANQNLTEEQARSVLEYFRTL